MFERAIQTFGEAAKRHRALAALRDVISRLIATLRERAKIRAVAHLMGIRVVALAGNVLSGLLTAKFLGPSGRGELAALIVAPAHHRAALHLGAACFADL